MPVLDIVKHLLSVDVGHIVVFGKFLAEERFTSTGLANQSGLKGLKTTLLAELFLYELNIGSKSSFAVPVEVSFLGRCVFAFRGGLSQNKKS